MDKGTQMNIVNPTFQKRAWQIDRRKQDKVQCQQVHWHHLLRAVSLQKQSEITTMPFSFYDEYDQDIKKLVSRNTSLSMRRTYKCADM